MKDIYLDPALWTLLIVSLTACSSASDRDSFARLEAHEVRVACADQTVHQSEAPIVRDSGGIEIVENWPPPGTLDDIPKVIERRSIGQRNGSEAYAFGEIVDALMVTDSVLAVADAMASDVRLFNIDGWVLSRLGGPGEGPGDFELLEGFLRASGDTIVVLDQRGSRTSYFVRDSLLGMRTLPVTPRQFEVSGQEFTTFSAPLIKGRLADSSMVVLRKPTQLRNTTEPGPVMYANLAFLDRVAPDGTVLDSLGSFVESLSYSYTFENKILVAGRTPFGSRSSVTVARNRIWLSHGHRPEVMEIDPHGSVARIIRLCRSPSPLTPRDIREYVDRYVAAGDNMWGGEKEDRERLEAISYPQFRPAFHTLILDSDGRLWVQDWTDADQPQLWHQFDGKGRRLGSIVVPADATVLDIAHGHLLARREDDLGVESLVIFALSIAVDDSGAGVVAGLN